LTGAKFAAPLDATGREGEDAMRDVVSGAMRATDLDKAEADGVVPEEGANPDSGFDGFEAILLLRLASLI
jgi:hypothetical protein